MMKMIIFFTLIATAMAIPTILHNDGHLVDTLEAQPLITGYQTVLEPETIKIHEPAIAKVGDLVQHIPTAVSHQSQTVVHNHANVITPIVTPAIKTYTHHVVKALTTPVLYAPATSLNHY